MLQGGLGREQVTHCNKNSSLPQRAMTPTHAIAPSERPQRFRHAVEGCGVVARGVSHCYESFTRKVLSIVSPPPIFHGVMAEAFTINSRGAGAEVRALRGNSRPLQFSAQNMLRFSAGFRSPISQLPYPISDLRPLTSDLRPLTSANCQLTSANFLFLPTAN